MSLKVRLISPKADTGYGANDGAYPPIGLLTMASRIKNSSDISEDLSEIDVVIEDQHHQEITFPSIDHQEIIGISVPSSVCYKNVLQIAKKAKETKNRVVVLGGPYVSNLPFNVMANQENVDFVLTGKSEEGFANFLLIVQKQYKRIKFNKSFYWREVHWDFMMKYCQAGNWLYNRYLPLPYELLSKGIKPYWEIYRQKVEDNEVYSFIVFTHFGCGYKQRKMKQHPNLLTRAGIPRFCTFCSLCDPLYARNPKDILDEVKYYIYKYQIPEGSKIHLKCYGDNINNQKQLLRELAILINQSDWWHKYDIQWIFYCQSIGLNKELAMLLKKVGTKKVFIGFDSFSDKVQRLNGLGTNLESHLRAIDICREYNIKIQAAFVFGLEGETPITLREQYYYFNHMMQLDILDRINTAILIIDPATPAYMKLLQKEPQIRMMDYLPPREMLQLWLKNFTSVSYDQVVQIASRMTHEFNGVHAKMGYNQD